jgi:hypothetical protein
VSEKLRVNGDLRGTPEVRVVGEGSENLGVLPLAEALRFALSRGLDLVEVNPRAKPPVSLLQEKDVFPASRALDGFGTPFPELPAALFGPDDRPNARQVTRTSVGQPGLEPETNGLRVHCSTN